jgi:hypothetical protein
MTMNFSDEILKAFVDGALDGASRRAIEQAMRDDPVMAQRVAQQRALRAQVSTGFSPAPGTRAMPQMPVRGGKVIQLALVRASKAKAPAAASSIAGAGVARWSWPQWGALAAMLVVGIVVGWLALSLLERDTSMVGRDGALRARGQLADALTRQAAGAAGSGVRIGSSFVSTQGQHCRSFVLEGVTGKSHLAGLACQTGAGWGIAAIIDDLAPPSSLGADTAGLDVPPLIHAVIDQRIAGQALDAAAEQEALRRGWRR